MSRGSLVVVGTGISVSHLTMEARSWICSAEKVLYCVADAATERLILKLNPSAESLYVYYGEGKPRRQTYQQMVDRTMECVREEKEVCVAYYGHPGIFVAPSHKSIKVAREEGYSARMLPAVSSLDCLFCDLGIDPATGCQVFEATDLLLRQRNLDVFSHSIIWQIAATGDLGFS